MSSTSASFPEERQRRGTRPNVPEAVGPDYIPTEDERRVFRECDKESFWYRSVPFSVASMAVTQALFTRGILSASSRFGSLPKVAFAGLFGFIAGKMSYMKTCQEKIKRLENSPLAEVFRQRERLSQQYSKGPQSELGDSDTQSLNTTFQSAESPSQTSTQTRDYGFGYNPDPPMQMDRPDDFSAPVQSFIEEEEQPRKKSILYEDLRLKNREIYEVALIQKAEPLVKTPPQKEPERPNIKAKKNIYGDTWEE
ncbi:OCIA domain-containing protein 1-like [Betta splendens]|uniref:OCIA domain-containing protein 1 n=1 Tax=Betta splendens TaxID=158456 RepID=A0A6P7M861_BETSP|nr:OCIA domain-containing protein 1-like [Betta splendens]